jgi:DegV family protein with EDD domain
MSIRVVTDSNCDLPAELTARYGIAVIPLYINIGDRSYLDGVELSRGAFYEALPHYEQPPTTSAPGVGMFAQLYDSLATGGATQVLSIHISASLSNTVNVAQLAAEATESVPVTIFDSGQLTLGTGLMAMEAARAAAQGRSMAEILALLQRYRLATHSFAALDTLEFLRRSGRLSRFQSSLGSLLNIKPLLKMHNGDMEMERVRTRGRATQRLIELVTELGPLEKLAVVHTHTPDRAQALAREAEHLFPQGGPMLAEEVTPVIGSHVGPGAVGFVAVTADPD